MRQLYRSFTKALATVFRFLIVGIRPLLGPATCRYPVGCTKYSLEMLKTKPLGSAVWLIIKRVASCNPF